MTDDAELLAIYQSIITQPEEDLHRLAYRWPWIEFDCRPIGTRQWDEITQRGEQHDGNR